jgi:transposase InsO family protein
VRPAGGIAESKNRHPLLESRQRAPQPCEFVRQEDRRLVVSTDVIPHACDEPAAREDERQREQERRRAASVMDLYSRKVVGWSMRHDLEAPLGRNSSSNPHGCSVRGLAYLESRACVV